MIFTRPYPHARFGPSVIHEGIKHELLPAILAHSNASGAEVTGEGEKGVEGDRAVLGDLDLREGELTLIIRAQAPG